MPARNIIKHFVEDAYYHVFNQGVNRSTIFFDSEDYETFLLLLSRHLSRSHSYSTRHKPYETYAGRIELQAYCLLPNRFHILLYLNNDTSAITELIRRVAGTYTIYFNKKYNRVGPLFQGTFKCSRLYQQEHIVHATRFIHREPEDFYHWKYSSLGHFIGDHKEDWVVPDRVYRMYEWGSYESYLNNLEHYRLAHEAAVPFLAHT